MNGRLIFGWGFQTLQFFMLFIIGMMTLFAKFNVTKEIYVILFGGIMLLGVNALSIASIISGSNKNEK